MHFLSAEGQRGAKRSVQKIAGLVTGRCLYLRLHLGRPFQLIQWKRCLLLDIAVTLTFEHSHVMMMSPFPRMVIRPATECLLVEWAAGIWEHGHRLAHPHSMRLEPLLPLADLITIIMICKNEIGLH